MSELEARINEIWNDLRPADGSKPDLEESALDLFPYLSDALLTDSLPSSQLQRVNELLSIIGDNAPARDLLLGIGEQLEKLRGDVADCYLDEEEEKVEGDDAEENGEAGKGDGKGKGDAAIAKKSLGAVVRKFEGVIGVAIKALPRFSPRKNPINHLQPLLTALSTLTADILLATQYGAVISPSSCITYITSTSTICKIAWSWFKTQPDTAHDEQKEVFLDPVLKALVNLHTGLELKLVERWYKGNCGELLSSKRRDALGKSLEKDEESLKGVYEGLNTIKNDLKTFGIEDNDLLSSMILHPSGILPHAALILLTSSLVPHPTQPNTLNHILSLPAAANLSASEILSMSMPVLGSALNGLAVEAGSGWVWGLVKKMSDEGEFMEDMTVEMLIELIMPTMANDPSDIVRTALLRLTGTMIRSIESPGDRIFLYDQLVSFSNPFEEVRLSGMSLLRAEVGGNQGLANKLRPATGNILAPSFASTLSPKLFALPTSQPPIKLVSLQDLMTSMHPAWTIECLNLYYTIKSMPRSEQAVPLWDEKAVQEEWLKPLGRLLEKWEKQAQGLTESEGGQMETDMSLFATRQAHDRVIQL